VGVMLQQLFSNVPLENKIFVLFRISVYTFIRTAHRVPRLEMSYDDTTRDETYQSKEYRDLNISLHGFRRL
jgi:hypothetical protein